MEILYEDNHLIAVNKRVGEIVQGDKTGDTPLPEIIKSYLKEKYNKSGNVFCGVVHRLDRPVSGVVLFAKTSKALERMNKMFADHSLEKTYWAIVKGCLPESEARLEHYLVRNEKQNKSYAYTEPKPAAKRAVLDYKVLSRGDNYSLLEINLETGRHHQIRSQLSSIGFPIKGDLKYGAPRSNPDGGISLLARSITFEHPVSGAVIHIEAPAPQDNLWRALTKDIL
jgi:23S rRNA pseudouridine1911/1915/1917 synthase